MSKQSVQGVNKAEDNAITPTQVGTLMRAVWAANRVPFLWGPPGIGKSEILKQQATAMNIAFIDIRLATRNPSQIAGVPFPVEIHGETVVSFSVPPDFPRDLDVDASVIVKSRKKVKFNTLNRKGSNKIHYCQNPAIAASSLDDRYVASIVDQGNDFFVVELHDEQGRPATAEVSYTIVGTCNALICFDELSSANDGVQAVAYTLINDRRLGDYEFPEGVRVCAAGNRMGDGGVVYDLKQPLRNRFSHYTLKVSWRDWVAHAKLARAYPAIIFMHEQQEGKALFDFDPDSEAMAWASPRSWMILSDIEYQLDRMKIEDPVLRLRAIEGTIGTKHALTYMNFKNDMSDLPSAVEIVDGVPFPKRSYSTSKTTWLATTIVWVLRNRYSELLSGGVDKKVALNSEKGDKFYKCVDNGLAFMKTNFPPDIVAGQVKMMSMKWHLPLDPRRMPAFKEFMAQNTSVIL